jgi:hypothetical protein
MNQRINANSSTSFLTFGFRKPLLCMILVPLLYSVTSSAETRATNSMHLAGPYSERFVRRIYLDLTGRLPTDEEVAEFQAVDFDLIDQLTTMLSTETAATTLSHLSDNIFQIHSANLPDFERMIAAGNSTLDSELDAQTRQAVTEEPRLHLRNILKNQSKPQQMFSGRTSYFNSVARDFWDIGSGVAAGTAEDPYFELNAGDDRPAIGIAASHGFLASIDSHADASGRRKAANLITQATCLNFDSVDAHNFKDIPVESLGSGLRAYSETQAQCASCHSMIRRLSGAINGLSRPDSFDSWKNFVDASETSGFYAGHKFNSIESFADKFSHDPAVRECLIKRTISALFQRRFDDSFDYESLLTMQSLLDLEETSFGTALRYLLFSSSYALMPLNNQTASALRNRVSGFRFLQQHQLEGIASQLGGKNHQISTSASLNLRNFGSLDSDSMMPSVEYHAAVTAYLRSLASKTISTEFSADSKANNRLIFKSLPDGMPADLSSTQIVAALSDAWKFLLRIEPDQSSAGFTELKKLFDVVHESEDSASKAFEAALAGIMLDPQFLSY